MRDRFAVVTLLTFLLLSSNLSCADAEPAKTASPEVPKLNSPVTASGKTSKIAVLVDGGTEGQLAVQALKEGKYKDAISHFQALYKTTKHPEGACYDIGLCYEHLGDTTQALQYYNFVVDHWPKEEAADLARSNLARLQEFLTLPKTWTSFSRGYQGHMHVPAMINGKPLVMMFDTGAAVCFATTSQLERFGIKINASPSQARMMGVGGEAETKTAVVELTVGSISRPVRLYIQDDHSTHQEDDSIMAHENVPLLGQSFYEDLAVEIDGRSHRIGFSAPQTTPVKDRDMAISYRKENNLIIVKPTIMGRECDMILDTGAASVVFTDRQYSGLGFSRPVSADAGSAMGVGGKRSGYSFFIHNIRLGPASAETVEASLAIYSAMPQPLLGASFLEHLHFTIEPKTKQIIFEKQ